MCPGIFTDMAAMHIKAGTKRVFGAPNVLRASTVLLAVQKVYYVGCFAGHPVSLMVKVCPPFCPLKDIPSTRCSEQMMHFLVHLKHPREGLVEIQFNSQTWLMTHALEIYITNTPDLYFLPYLYFPIITA